MNMEASNNNRVWKTFKKPSSIKRSLQKREKDDEIVNKTSILIHPMDPDDTAHATRIPFNWTILTIRSMS